MKVRASVGRRWCVPLLWLWIRAQGPSTIPKNTFICARNMCKLLKIRYQTCSCLSIRVWGTLDCAVTTLNVSESCPYHVTRQIGVQHLWRRFHVLPYGPKRYGIRFFFLTYIEGQIGQYGKKSSISHFFPLTGNENDMRYGKKIENTSQFHFLFRISHIEVTAGNALTMRQTSSILGAKIHLKTSKYI